MAQGPPPITDSSLGGAERAAAAAWLPPVAGAADAPSGPLVRVYTMGRFALARGDEPIVFHGKAQNRPIDLLKALVALGGHAVADARLIDILWPDPARAGSGKALEIAIHRLRKLLGAEGAVVVGHRAVTLSSRQVWVDAWELERMLASLVPAGAPPPIHLLEAKAADVLALYRGHFLPDECDAAWPRPLGDRLAWRLDHFLDRLVGHWEATGQWSRAAELCERAIELDPLAEPFYRHQMTCLGALGFRSHVVGAFRRCRRMLSLTLGIAPGQETEEVYRRLLYGGPPAPPAAPARGRRGASNDITGRRRALRRTRLERNPPSHP